MSSIGHVDGGPATVVDALMNVVGKSGAIIMSNYPLSLPIPLTEEERSSGIGWKLRKLPEDSRERTTTGAVSDEFRWRHDVATGTGIHRVCAWGTDAHIHVKGYEHLLNADGWVLLLGVGIDRCSSLHLGERVPISKEVRDQAKKPQPQRGDFEEIKKQYPEDIVLGWSERTEGPGPWDIVRNEADRRGMIRRSTIGSAACMFFRARQVVGLYEYLRRNDPISLWPHESTEQEKGTIA